MGASPLPMLWVSRHLVWADWPRVGARLIVLKEKRYLSIGFPLYPIHAHMAFQLTVRAFVCVLTVCLTNIVDDYLPWGIQVDVA